MYIWNHEAYRDNTNILGYYEYIWYDVSDKTVGIEAEVEIDVES